jgi:hypothetical protein
MKEWLKEAGVARQCLGKHAIIPDQYETTSRQILFHDNKHVMQQYRNCWKRCLLLALTQGYIMRASECRASSNLTN